MTCGRVRALVQSRHVRGMVRTPNCYRNASSLCYSKGWVSLATCAEAALIRRGAMSEADPKGYYACLGVKPWAAAADIRAAYHHCAKQCHPDVDPRPEAKARFQTINEAYRILINPLERAIYHRSAGAARPQSYAMSLRPVFTRVAEIAGPWFTQGRMGI